MDKKLSVSVNIDARIFRDFAMFDAFRVKKRWRPPTVFALIMLGFAAVCFYMSDRAEQGLLVGAVLAAVGLLLPLAYLLNFLASVNAQIKRFGLHSPQYAYTVTLSDGIEVETKNGEKARYEWASVYGAFKRRDCVYLYVKSNRAFILPDRDAGEAAEDLRAIIGRWAR